MASADISPFALSPDTALTPGEAQQLVMWVRPEVAPTTFAAAPILVAEGSAGASTFLNDFWRTCSNRGATYTICWTADNQHVFGGYASESWGEKPSSGTKTQDDPLAFLFMVRRDGSPDEQRIPANRADTALQFESTIYGPVFGSRALAVSAPNMTLTANFTQEATFSNFDWQVFGFGSSLPLRRVEVFAVSDILSRLPTTPRLIPYAPLPMHMQVSNAPLLAVDFSPAGRAQLVQDITSLLPPAAGADADRPPPAIVVAGVPGEASASLINTLDSIALSRVSRVAQPAVAAATDGDAAAAAAAAGAEKDKEPDAATHTLPRSITVTFSIADGADDAACGRRVVLFDAHDGSKVEHIVGQLAEKRARALVVVVSATADDAELSRRAAVAKALIAKVCEGPWEAEVLLAVDKLEAVEPALGGGIPAERPDASVAIGKVCRKLAADCDLGADQDVHPVICNKNELLPNLRSDYGRGGGRVANVLKPMTSHSPLLDSVEIPALVLLYDALVCATDTERRAARR